MALTEKQMNQLKKIAKYNREAAGLLESLGVGAFVESPRVQDIVITETLIVRQEQTSIRFRDYHMTAQISAHGTGEVRFDLYRQTRSTSTEGGHTHPMKHCMAETIVSSAGILDDLDSSSIKNPHQTIRVIFNDLRRRYETSFGGENLSQ